MGEKKWGRDRNRGNFTGGGSSRGKRDLKSYRGEERRESSERSSYGGGERSAYGRSSGGGYRGAGRREGGERRDYSDRPSGGGYRGERRGEGEYRPREGGEKRSFGGEFRERREGGYRAEGGGYRGEGRREGRERRPFSGGERRGYGDKPSGGGYREGGERRPFSGERREGLGFRNQERREEGSGGRFDRSKFMKRAREETTEVLRSRDMYLALLSNCIEEEERVANQLGERLEEIYGLYFPELKVENKRNYALIVNMITKEDVPLEAVAKYVGEGKARQIAEAGKNSVGGDFKEKDVENMKKMAEEIEAIYALMNRHEKHMDDVAREECPNLHYLVGAKVAGKLISVAGGMKKLAILPASTIQVMGAEKALFKHLRNRNIAPPKHGVIFQHASISTAPKNVRGKIARALATKISLAAKADVYTKRFIGPMIKEKFEKRLKEINENAARARGKHEDTPSG